jgi:GT2 family glycosyltransferase
MGKLPQLSIITVFRNQKDEAEQILTALYEMKGLDFELIIYDNASQDGTIEMVESLISHYDHENTFFYINDQEEARGSVLNKALAGVNGLYLWMIDSLPAITKPVINQGIERMRTSSKIYAYLGKNNTPENHAAALDAVSTGKLPCDSVFIFNLRFLPVRERFLNPFLSRYHAFELCIRSGIGSFSGTDDVADGLAMSKEIPPVRSEKRELMYSLQRAADPENTALAESIAQALQRTTGIKADDRPDPSILLAEARYYRREGQAGSALEMLDRLMEIYPDNQDARRLKVDILESQRRYVEAAELKHGLRSDKAGSGSAMDAPEKPVKEVKVEAEVEKDDLIEGEEAKAEADVLPEETETYLDDSDADLDQDPDLFDGNSEEEAEKSEQADKVGVERDLYRVTVIIPTAIHRKPMLEECLTALAEHTDPSSTELIIIDNASLDDTFDYLDQLRLDGFMNIRIIRNKVNRGFSASANQGIRAAKGNYICVIHNDVFIPDDVTGKLADLLESNPEFGVIGPVTNRCMNPDQISDGTAEESEVNETIMIDSFCMMFRAAAAPEFDENYGLAYAEDADICQELRAQGWKIGIAAGVFAKHYQGATTLEIGLDINGPEYWINAAFFNKKWGLETELPDLGDKEEMEQLAILGGLINTYRPEEELLSYAEGLLSSETRTRITEAKPNRETLSSLIRILMLLDQRDILRTVEEKMDHYEADPALALRLIHYYFERNIYSRCMKYIKACGPGLPVTEKVFRLKIAIGEKDMDLAVTLLNELMNEAPVHPGIYKLAGDIHIIENNRREADEFYNLAIQIDPIRYGKSGKSETPFETVI